MIMGRIKKEFLDKGISKIMSRKLLVWVIATIGVPLNLLDGEQWMQISMVYIGSQAAKDFIIDYVRAKQGQPPNTEQ
jgi:hypothetical protein